MGGGLQGEHNIRQQRIDQGKRDVRLSISDDRKRVILAFKKACEKGEEKERRKTMEEQIKSYMENRPGTITSDANASTIEKSIVQVPLLGPSGNSTPGKDTSSVSRDSPVDREEMEFQRRLEEAKAISLQSNHGTKDVSQSEPNAQQDPSHLDEEYDKELRMAIEISLAEQRAYERGFLQAAAKWKEGEAPVK